MTITADLRSKINSCSIDIEAPKEGRSTTRVNWLLRQLKDAPENLIIETFFVHGRSGSMAELIKTVRLDPNKIIDPEKEIKSFRVTYKNQMGAGRSNKTGQKNSSFIESVLKAVDGCYFEVGQVLQPWRPSAPKMQEKPSEERPSIGGILPPPILGASNH